MLKQSNESFTKYRECKSFNNLSLFFYFRAGGSKTTNSPLNTDFVTKHYFLYQKGSFLSYQLKIHFLALKIS